MKIVTDNASVHLAAIVANPEIAFGYKHWDNK